MFNNEAEKVCFLATHRATYFERIVRIIPQNGKSECQFGMGKQVRGQKDYLTVSTVEEGNIFLDMLYQLFGDSWSFDTVPAHIIGVR